MAANGRMQRQGFGMITALCLSGMLLGGCDRVLELFDRDDDDSESENEPGSAGPTANPAPVPQPYGMPAPVVPAVPAPTVPTPSVSGGKTVAAPGTVPGIVPGTVPASPGGFNVPPAVPSVTDDPSRPIPPPGVMRPLPPDTTQ